MSRALGLSLLLCDLLACAPTIRTPLKQALPSVTGDTAVAAGPCLGEPARIDLGGPVVGGALADLDGNGVKDVALAVAGPGGGAAVFLLHDGQGGLKQSMRVPIPQTPTAIAADDFNNDGLDDLAIGAADPPALHVLLARGRGEFIAGATPLRTAPAALWVAKLDGNDSVDLLALDQGGKAVRALLGDGHGEFLEGKRNGLPTAAQPAALTLVDADRDQILDLAVLGDSRREAAITLIRGDGHGSFKRRSSGGWSAAGRERCSARRWPATKATTCSPCSTPRAPAPAARWRRCSSTTARATTPPSVTSSPAPSPTPPSPTSISTGTSTSSAPRPTAAPSTSSPATAAAASARPSPAAPQVSAPRSWCSTAPAPRSSASAPARSSCTRSPSPAAAAEAAPPALSSMSEKTCSRAPAAGAGPPAPGRRRHRDHAVSRYLEVIGSRAIEEVDSQRAARSAITSSARKRPRSLHSRTCPNRHALKYRARGCSSKMSHQT
ncbi:VCBS repeat-containing protein [Nannocystis pusilla]|uniref:VCBS repeat-containing protein n=1 Tax=Nannocystis pusilla TaxID=889268 RepID=A0A9X3ERM8_9BACT|nr:VCBS repeat-containing protein [Nannocystis pusilla]